MREFITVGSSVSCAEIWSPAGGFFPDPKHWRRNTLIAVMYVNIYPAPIWIQRLTMIVCENAVQRSCCSRIARVCQEHISGSSSCHACRTNSFSALGTTVISQAAISIPSTKPQSYND